MKTIYKYPLEVTDNQSVQMPEGAHIFSAQVQHGQLCCWALVDPDAEKVSRDIGVFGTGHPVPDGDRQYIDTVQLHGGSLIFHVFENRT